MDHFRLARKIARWMVKLWWYGEDPARGFEFAVVFFVVMVGGAIVLAHQAG
jgi:hypothetical protein